MTRWMKDPCLWNGFAQHTENSIGVDRGALISPRTAEPGSGEKQISLQNNCVPMYNTDS